MLDWLRMRRQGLWFCVAASVLLHAGVLALLPAPYDRPRLVQRAKPIELRIQAAPPVHKQELMRPKVASSRPGKHQVPATASPSFAEPAVEREARAADRKTIDLDAARALAIESARGEKASLEELVFERPRLEARLVLARGIAQATVADCRTAYSGLLLLAVPMLVLDALRDGGCRW